MNAGRTSQARESLLPFTERIRDAIWDAPEPTGLVGIPTPQADAIIHFFAQREQRMVEALKDILDVAERAHAGFMIESEEWYARRDYARRVVEKGA